MSPHAEGESTRHEPIDWFGTSRRRKKRRERNANPEDACPQCRTAEKVVPIYYGKPTEDLNKKSRRGELVLGGDRNPEGRPRRHCKGCGLDF